MRIFAAINLKVMKKLLSLMVVLFLLGTINGLAQEKKYSVYAIGFYNLENLFLDR